MSQIEAMHNVYFDSFAMDFFYSIKKMSEFINEERMIFTIPKQIKTSQNFMKDGKSTVYFGSKEIIEPIADENSIKSKPKDTIKTKDTLPSFVSLLSQEQKELYSKLITSAESNGLICNDEDFNCRCLKAKQ